MLYNTHKVNRITHLRFSTNSYLFALHAYAFLLPAIDQLKRAVFNFNFLEPFQGVGGANSYPDGYLKDVYAKVRANGGVCVADEVQTGFGRTGTHYWGFECHDVVPDIVVMAKGIGNGFPMAAIVTTKEIASQMSKVKLIYLAMNN